MTSAASGFLRRDARPPIDTDAAPAPDAAEVVTPSRVTALPRPWIRPRLADPAVPGHAPDDPAVRRFWTAVVGPGAVADLLRLTAAARSGRKIRRPVHLSLLLREGLAHWDGHHVLVHPNVPALAPTHWTRLRPALRVEYRPLVSGGAGWA